MKEPTQEQKEGLKKIYRAEVWDSFIATLKFVPLFVGSVVAVSFLGTFVLKSEEFVQYGGFFNGLFMSIVYLNHGKERRDKFSKQIEAVLKN